MIVTLTLNPAVDKYIDVEKLIPEKKIRCGKMRIEAGGGGINVSKAINVLGGNSMAIFTSGGQNGQLLTELLKGVSMKINPVHIQANTRENIVINELSTNRQYKFVTEGCHVSTKEAGLIKQAINGLRNVSYLVFSGSLPPGLPADFLGEIAVIAKEKNIKFIVDTSGEPLKAALTEGVYMIKPNMSELCFLAGKEYLQLDQIENAGKEVIKTGQCEILVISMGPEGAMLMTKNRMQKFHAPVVKKINTVGAGDSMVGGIVWMLEQGKSLNEALQFGVACGTAASINAGPELFRKDDALRFYKEAKYLEV